MCEDGAGVETHREIRRAGTSRRALAACVDSGSFVRLRRGVYAAAGACELARTAALHGGGLACVTAARHLGLWVLTDAVEPHVWLHGHGHARIHDECSCVVHWEGEPGLNAFGLPPVWVVLRQMLVCRGIEELFVALESALRLREITRADVVRLRAAIPPAAREAVDLARSDADSGLESLLRWRLRHHNLRIRTQQSIVSVGTVDCVIGDRLIVEVDGVENHDGESHRHRDLVRDANAAAWGYSTLRFDYAMVVHDWETVELAILASIDRGLHLAS